MSHLNWKLIVGIFVALLLILLLLRRLTRTVPPYQPPPEGPTVEWGSVDSETARRLQSVLDEQVNRLRVPGLQAYVRTPDGKTWSGTSGTSDLARKHPLQRDSVVRVGSVTKTFTAVLILQLAEAGLVGLDDPLGRYLPGYPNAAAITIRQLLDHSSGIPEFLDTPNVLMKSILWWTKWQPQEVVDIAAKRQAYFAPGAGWHYSNTNYVLLGQVAERVTGKTMAELLRTRLIDPLQLRHTYFVPYEEAPAALVPGFDRDLSHFPGLLDINRGDTSWATAAFSSGALASTADDLGSFYQHLFAGELLSPSSMKEMTTFVSASNPGFGVQDGYAPGLMRLNVDGQELIGHVGEFMGSTAIAMYAPDKKYLVVVTTNLSYPNLVDVVKGLQQVIA